jgi:hypothetical protein
VRYFAVHRAHNENPGRRVAVGSFARPRRFSEKVVALWLGAEQGLFRKHGVNYRGINIAGPQTMAALVSGDIKLPTPFPDVVSAATRVWT